MCICVQGHVNVYTLFVKKEISSDIVSLCVHVCPFVCGRECIRGPIRIQEPQVPSYIISHQSCILHHIMRVVIWLLYCRPEVTHYHFRLTYSILEKIPLSISSQQLPPWKYPLYPQLSL